MPRMLIFLLLCLCGAPLSVYSAEEMAQPIPFYHNPDLALSVRRSDAHEWQLLFCAQGERSLLKQYPLVLSVDGEFVKLKHLPQESLQRDGYRCQGFDVSVDQLQRIASARQVLLRAFFDQGRVDVRVSGTEADYLTRPQAMGPLGQIEQFVGIHINSAEVLVDGG